MLTLVALATGFFAQPFLFGAHRGGVGVMPENTALAFADTARRYPDALLETDVRITKDGALILLHDETVDRTTNGHGRLQDLTLAEAKRLDAGYTFSRDGGKSFPFRGRDVRLTTLAEALRSAPKHRFELDVKGVEVVDPLVKILRAERAEGRVIIASFVPAVMAKIRQALPGVATCYDFANGARLLSALRGSDWAKYQPEAPVLSMMKEQVVQYRLTPAEIQRIRDKGIRFQIHTLDEPAEIQRWLVQGVDSILTDRPDILDAEITRRTLGRAHAHNDYAHPHPLRDAMDQRFLSIEADIFLVDGELRVGHNRTDLRPGRTLEALYLDPLMAAFRENRGQIYDRPGQVTLLVDIKENGAAVYAALAERLMRYREMLSARDPKTGEIAERAVKIVLSGDRPVEAVRADAGRMAFIDGRIPDLAGGIDTSLIAWVSDDYGDRFRWNGTGEMPSVQRDQLRLLVAEAHRAGVRFRLWGVPDTADAWREFYEAGVDLVNTDNLAGLATFLRRR